MFKKPFWIDDNIEFKHIKIFSEGVRNGMLMVDVTSSSK